MGFYDAIPGHTTAYHQDSSSDEYYGKAPRGVGTGDSQWRIFKKEYDGKNWLIKWPSGDDSPRYIWDNVAVYTYELLRKR